VQGGAQRFTIELITELQNQGLKIRLITFYPPDTDFFDLPPGVEVIRLIYPFHDNGRVPSTLLNFLGPYRLRVSRIYWRMLDLHKLRALLKDEESSLTLSIERYVGVLVGLVHPNSRPMVVSERVHPDYHEIPFPFNLLVHFVYRKKNIHIHAQSASIAEAIKKRHNKDSFVIPNAVLSPKTGSSRVSKVEKKTKRVISVGRYANQKGFDLLIKAWSKLPSELRSYWKLEIYGDGERKPYEELVKFLDIEESVRLNPASHNVADEIEKSSIFVLASRYEGFPNALAEAMALGVACIATDCPSAVRDLTLKGKLAQLCSIDENAISEALLQLMTNEDRQRELGIKAKTVIQCFSVNNVTAKWISQFKFLADSHN
jgi:GalNAc-alpha-(1->4)-GalNAc-alpha-(1->3)-diNAcBac-PP-undecaprenol alpha-1,4-N-acetyl-D-galactosaminyltransferase